ncbi:MAG: GTP cyclohydrolase I FolE [Sulfolobales archaeon]|nr:GTP cyclohydrolase I FolE [Sulfolobales archaeon]MDW7969388.1 GTP cyclohydrolase I FolE [Sulfolobales archaeon]
MDKFERVKEIVRELLELIGEDPSREGLVDTPDRVARMWLHELTSGYGVDPNDVLKYFQADKDYERHGDLIIVKDIPLRSICEHHLLPFFGYVHIAYVPNDKIVGFSKFARLVDVFSRRLQIQERLTENIADFIYRKLTPKGVMVVMEAYHTCTIVRGVKEPMYMITRSAKGTLSDEISRIEALTLMGLGKGRIFADTAYR